jgi:hypothetical protein
VVPDEISASSKLPCMLIYWLLRIFAQLSNSRLVRSYSESYAISSFNLQGVSEVTFHILHCWVWSFAGIHWSEEWQRCKR